MFFGPTVAHFCTKFVINEEMIYDEQLFIDLLLTVHKTSCHFYVMHWPILHERFFYIGSQGSTKAKI